MTANAPLLRATSMYPRREFLEPLGQTARRLRAIVAEVKAQDALRTSRPPAGLKRILP